MSAKGTLWLIPAPLGDETKPWLLEEERLAVVGLQHFVVEAPKTARKHLKALGVETPIRELSLETLDEHTKFDELSLLLEPLLNGLDMGLISEAGCPAVADPGAALVALAHRHDIVVRPLVGACSILLALMASGANGQRFTFCGYLPAERTERLNALKKLEKTSQQNDETQIFIETPYRNMALLQDALNCLNGQSRLCVASNLTLSNELIISKKVKDWPKDIPDLHKQPCIFVLHHQ